MEDWAATVATVRMATVVFVPASSQLFSVKSYKLKQIANLEKHHLKATYSFGKAKNLEKLRKATYSFGKAKNLEKLT